MNKLDFLLLLHDKLAALPSDEVERGLNFYSEMIEDRMEEGMTEEEAVASVGSVDEIAAQIAADIPLVKIAKKNLKPKRRLAAWEIVLIVLGSPIWISLAAAAFAVIVSIFAVFWSVIVSLWAVFAALCGVGVGLPVGGIVFVACGNALSGVAAIGVGLASAGLAIFAFFGCLAATKGAAWLTKQSVIGIKKCFVKKEGAA